MTWLDDKRNSLIAKIGNKIPINNCGYGSRPPYTFETLLKVTETQATTDGGRYMIESSKSIGTSWHNRYLGFEGRELISIERANEINAEIQAQIDHRKLIRRMNDVDMNRLSDADLKAVEPILSKYFPKEV